MKLNGIKTTKQTLLNPHFLSVCCYCKKIYRIRTKDITKTGISHGMCHEDCRG